MDVWLSHLTLPPRAVPLKKGLLDGQSLHRTLMRLVPDNLGDHPRQQGGLLYRVESGKDGVTVLAQTLTRPRLGALPAGFAEHARDRSLTPFLARLQPGMSVRYRIVANTTKRNGSSADPKLRGKLTVLRGSDADLWWLRKATEAGLHPLHLVSSPTADILGAHHTRHGLTRLDGTGIVTDPDRLRAALTHGIGRGKSYGCGMLSLGPTEAR